MIALTVFFGIFGMTAAIWGPLYFIKTARRRQADPERQTANGTPSQDHHSDRATVGGEAPLARFVNSCQQRLAGVVASVSHMFQLRGAAPTTTAGPEPLALETVSAWVSETQELDELTPDGEDSVDVLADIDVPMPDPTANGQVDVDEINDLVEVVARRESNLVPFDEGAVSHDNGQDEDLDEQQGIAEEAQAGASGFDHHSGASMATTTACKMG